MSEKFTLFDRFGGTRKMAEALDEAPSTVQSWKTAGRIPAAHQPKVLAKAGELGIGITAEDVIFPMGRDSIAADDSASATNSPENIGSWTEADSPDPFTATGAVTAASSSTCSLTNVPSPLSVASQTFSTGTEAEAA